MPKLGQGGWLKNIFIAAIVNAKPLTQHCLVIFRRNSRTSKQASEAGEGEQGKTEGKRVWGSCCLEQDHEEPYPPFMSLGSIPCSAKPSTFFEQENN